MFELEQTCGTEGLSRGRVMPPAPGSPRLRMYPALPLVECTGSVGVWYPPEGEDCPDDVILLAGDVMIPDDVMTEEATWCMRGGD